MSMMRKIAEFLPEFAARLTAKSDRAPIVAKSDMHRFVATRSAFVAQKTLYGYMKTRMGTRYPSMFENDEMIASIDIAKMHMYAACVADLAVYCVAYASGDTQTNDDVRRRISTGTYDFAIAENVDDSVDDRQRAEWRDAFVARLADTDWQRSAADPEHDLESPATLLKWAPIAPDLKKLDVEVVHNSVRFAWYEVRSQFRKRCDSAALNSSLTTG